MNTDENPASDSGLQVEPADFVAGGAAAGQIDVRISYGIIDRFSEGLYSSSNKAFEELISNSYDAGASRVWNFVPEKLDQEDARLAVVDDGVSMDLDGLRSFCRSACRLSATRAAATQSSMRVDDRSASSG